MDLVGSGNGHLSTRGWKIPELFVCYLAKAAVVTLMFPFPVPRSALPQLMARWPRHIWTSIFTYGVMFVLFPILCWLAYGWVQGWFF